MVGPHSITQLSKTSSKKNNGQVCGVQIKDLSQANLETLEINAHVIINATGPWTDQLRSQVQGTARIRPQRGSHLIFPESRLPLQYAVTMMHPRDKRAMFAIPWEGTTIIGTTDLDHTNSINIGEPFCTQQEIDYMLEACAAFFPSAKLCQDDVVSSFAGLRPIVTSGTANPSAESRKHVVWDEDGLITVSGGKLSIFRIMAADALQKASVHLPHPPKPMQCFYKPLKEVPVQAYDGVDLETYTYLAGRYGEDVFSLLELAEPQEHSAIEGLANTWAELRFAAGTTAVEHLDDLLLRRVRLGLLLPEGASALLPQIRMLTQDALGWDDTRWDQEVLRYHSIYNKYYSPAPSGCTIQEGE